MSKQFSFFLILFLIHFRSFSTVIVQNGLTHEYDLGINSKIQGKTLLKNNGVTPQAIKVYFKDLNSECNGQINYADAGVNAQSLFPFIKINNADYTLQPGEDYELLYEIDLSKNNNKEGTHWVLMMVEVVDPISKSSPSKGFEIGSKIRYGIQIIANMGSKKLNDFSFKNIKINKDVDHNKTIEIAIENQNDFLVIPNLNLQIFDDKGIKIRDLTIPAKKVYPKNCQMFTFSLSGIEKGKYQAVLLADYLDENVGVNIDLEI
jgi:hypothetical protein